MVPLKITSLTCSLEKSIVFGTSSSWCFLRNLTTFFTSFSEMNGDCTRIGFGESLARYSMSPFPRSFSAPAPSRMVFESTTEGTWRAIRVGIFALMSPVTTFTEGRCVERIRWMPTARLFAASRTILASSSFGYSLMISASSSMTITIYGIVSGRFARSSSSISSFIFLRAGARILA